MSRISRVHVIRLQPREDLKKALVNLAEEKALDAAVILTCVGSLEQMHLRFANNKSGTKRPGFFEIVSLVGTLSRSGAHVHASVSDENGTTIGGHLLEENLIYTTAEIAIAELEGIRFHRVVDPYYGYRELEIQPL